MANNPSSTQQFIDIAGIKEGIIILKNGNYRLVLSASSINFSLKSEQEQNSLIFQYQSFLNSLHFPIEIVIQSKKLDLNQYIKKIRKIQGEQKNELIALQTEDYVDFVGELINVANIMKKTFYVVIGFDPMVIKNSIMDRLFKKDDPAQMKISDQEFKHHKQQLVERANVVATGLAGMGIQCVQLTTEQIIELFYKIYNPEIADKERFTDVSAITPSMVTQKDEKNEKPQATDKEEEEAVIDNSALVEERNKQEAQMKEREEIKEGEKTIATTPASPKAPSAPTQQQASAPVQPAPTSAPLAPTTAPGQPAVAPPAPNQGPATNSNNQQVSQ